MTSYRLEFASRHDTYFERDNLFTRVRKLGKTNIMIPSNFFDVFRSACLNLFVGVSFEIRRFRGHFTRFQRQVYHRGEVEESLAVSPDALFFL